MTTLPREMEINAAGAQNELQTRSFPTVKGGICDYCGVIDPNYPGQVQYKLCPHYKGMNLRCSFCKESADHDDVVRMSAMLVKEDPYRPGTLVTLCGSFECTRKFKQKYHITEG